MQPISVDPSARRERREVASLDLVAAGGDDLVDAGDAVVEEVRDPPLLLE